MLVLYVCPDHSTDQHVQYIPTHLLFPITPLIILNYSLFGYYNSSRKSELTVSLLPVFNQEIR